MPTDFSPAEMAAFASLGSVVVGVAVGALKFRAWVHAGAMEALRSEDGRRAVVAAVLDSAQVTERMRVEAEHKAASAVAAVAVKLDILATEVRAMRQDIAALAAKIDKHGERTHELETRVTVVESHTPKD